MTFIMSDYLVTHRPGLPLLPVVLPPGSLCRAGLNQPTSLCRGEGHGEAGRPQNRGGSGNDGDSEDGVNKPSAEFQTLPKSRLNPWHGYWGTGFGGVWDVQPAPQPHINPPSNPGVFHTRDNPYLHVKRMPCQFLQCQPSPLFLVSFSRRQSGMQSRTEPMYVSSHLCMGPSS